MYGWLTKHYVLFKGTFEYILKNRCDFGWLNVIDNNVYYANRQKENKYCLYSIMTVICTKATWPSLGGAVAFQNSMVHDRLITITKDNSIYNPESECYFLSAANSHFICLSFFLFYRIILFFDRIA